MKYAWRLLTILLVTSTRVLAHPVEFSGTLFDEAAYTDLNEASLYNPHNRLLTLYDRRNVLTADVYTGIRLAPYLTVRSSLQASIERERQTRSRFFLRELFLKLSPTNVLEVTLGRAILKWGTGYAYNPTGVIEPRRDPSDPSDRLRRFRGLDLLQADLYIRSGSLTLVYLNTLKTGDRWRMANDHRVALRLSTLFRGLDVSLIGFWERDRQRKVGLNFTKVLGEALEVHGELLGQRDPDAPQHLITTISTPDTLFRSLPFAPLSQRQPRLFVKYLIGFQYTFRGGINLAMEYFHNDEGLNGEDWRRFLDYLAFANRELSNPRWNSPQGNLAAANLLWSTGVLSSTGATREYLFVRLYLPDLMVTQVSGEVIALENLHDGSAVVIPSLSVYLGHQTSAYLRWSGFLGKRESEYGGFLYRSVTNAGVSWKF